MEFLLGKSYSKVDFEEVSLNDLELIGGGCGGTITTQVISNSNSVSGSAGGNLDGGVGSVEGKVSANDQATVDTIQTKVEVNDGTRSFEVDHSSGGDKPSVKIECVPEDQIQTTSNGDTDGE